MATTPFQYNGQTYSIDEQGTIRNNMGAQITGQLGVAQAAAAAVSGTAPLVPGAAAAPASAAPAPAPGGLSSNFSVHQTGTDQLSPPPTKPVLPSTPPRVGAGSATELRSERDRVQKQIDALAAKQTSDGFLSSADTGLLTSLNGRMTSLTESITKAEAPKEKAPSVLRSSGSPDDQYNLVDNGDGTVTPSLNPNWNGTVKPQVVQAGNHWLNVTPPTREQLAADPTAKPTITVAYTDTDAQTLANRQTAVSEGNAKTSAAAQATQDFAAHSQADLAERVSKGEDAASIRAEQTQKLQELHDAWVRADGDRRAAQQSLDSYNTDRHAQAQENLTAQQIAATSEAQARQDATTRYGYDKSAETSRYTADVAARTSKMNAGAQILQNALTMLQSINKDLPPGSDLAGKALPGLLAYGQKFLNELGGAAPAAPSDSSKAIDPTQPLSDQVGVQPPAAATPAPGAVLASPLGRAPETSAESEARNAAPPPSATPAGGLNWLFNSAASPVATPGNTPTAMPATPPPAMLPPTDPNAAMANAMAAQNAATHQANMSPDGSPWAHPNDVARIFGRGAAA